MRGVFFLFLLQVLNAETNVIGLCESDEDCAKWPDTVCIAVNTFEKIDKKCTPNKKGKPACRGASSGLCPSYQPSNIGFLNPQCIFEDLENSDLALDANVTLCKVGNSDAHCWLNIKNGNDTITGRYRCVDSAACPELSAFPDECDACKTGRDSNCNDRGTCTHVSQRKMEKRGCVCYSGFSGSRCEKTVSNACDIDCGSGGAFGDCVKGKCKCKNTWAGDIRCAKCTSDKACENGGTCEKKSGKCQCKDGYGGLTCGGTQHSCVGVRCGRGTCIDGECYCKQCIGDICPKCEDSTCGECTSTAVSIHLSLTLAIFSALTYITLN